MLYMKPLATAHENATDRRLALGSHWALISNRKSMSLPHGDNGGVISCGRVTCGSKIWLTRNPDIPGETDPGDIRYVMDVAKRDTERTAGHNTWVPTLFRTNDILWV